MKPVIDLSENEKRPQQSLTAQQPGATTVLRQGQTPEINQRSLLIGVQALQAIRKAFSGSPPMSGSVLINPFGGNSRRNLRCHRSKNSRDQPERGDDEEKSEENHQEHHPTNLSVSHWAKRCRGAPQDSSEASLRRSWCSGCSSDLWLMATRPSTPRLSVCGPPSGSE